MTTVYYNNYEPDNPKLRLKENIRISKKRVKGRCLWCRSYIEEGEYCYSINNVALNAGKHGNFLSDNTAPVFIHFECVMPMANRMESHKQDNIKRLVISGLK